MPVDFSAHRSAATTNPSLHLEHCRISKELIEALRTQDVSTSLRYLTMRHCRFGTGTELDNANTLLLMLIADRPTIAAATTSNNRSNALPSQSAHLHQGFIDYWLGSDSMVAINLAPGQQQRPAFNPLSRLERLDIGRVPAVTIKTLRELLVRLPNLRISIEMKCFDIEREYG